jgi:hypothetical protein
MQAYRLSCPTGLVLLLVRLWTLGRNRFGSGWACHTLQMIEAATSGSSSFSTTPDMHTRSEHEASWLLFYPVTTFFYLLGPGGITSPFIMACTTICGGSQRRSAADERTMLDALTSAFVPATHRTSRP